MEPLKFVSEVFNDGKLIVTRVGWWHHLRDVITGEEKWVWVGASKNISTKPALDESSFLGRGE